MLIRCLALGYWMCSRSEDGCFDGDDGSRLVGLGDQVAEEEKIADKCSTSVL